MDLKERIDELAGLMAEFGLAEGELAGEGWRVALKKSRPSKGAQAGGASEAFEDDPHHDINPAPIATLPTVEAAPKGTPVNSPMNGIYYTASSPSAPAFVKEGDIVEAGQVVGLIEAMKVFNEIVAPMAGTVTELKAQNGQLVQPGEPLLYIA
ncbi:MAG TPA: acetyl-CoA carboxylase biotin carboxyl carrier protein subunit [Fimbriimonadaceae bacterium]|nr:acetyl-CoA carboxylase biotin carboxyl carrier protein subunit [Fimbriimonadaceae bacterium]